MRNQPHPWNLRRIFGRQFVGCVGRPSRPEAGIATRIIPAQSSGRVCRRLSNADLATWRPVHLIPAAAQTFPPPSTPRSWMSPQAFPPSHACSPRAQQLFQCLPRCCRAAQSSSILSFPWQRRGTTFESMQAFSLMSSLCVVRRSSILLPN